jgi:hypothetical protein
MDLPIQLEHFLLLDFDVLLAFLNFLYEFLLSLQLIRLQLFPLVPQLLCDLLHIVHKTSLFIYLFLIGLDGSLAG